MKIYDGRKNDAVLYTTDGEETEGTVMSAKDGYIIFRPHYEEDVILYIPWSQIIKIEEYSK